MVENPHASKLGAQFAIDAQSLSPLLFVIALDALSNFLHTEKEFNRIEGVRFGEVPPKMISLGVKMFLMSLDLPLAYIVIGQKLKLSF